MGLHSEFPTIYMVFRRAALLYMVERVFHHVDLFARHVKFVSTWVYMLQGHSPCKQVYMGKASFVHVDVLT